MATEGDEPMSWLELWRERRLLRASRPLRGPERVYVGVTDRCNYRCVMCASHSPLVSGLPPEGQRAEMSLEVFRALIQDLGELGGTRQIVLAGIGEPLLHPDLFAMAAAVKQAGFGLCIVTNGALLNEEKCQHLVDLGVERLHVSLNAGSEETYGNVCPTAPPGTRQRILDCLAATGAYCDRQRMARPQIMLTAVLFKQTYRDLDGLVGAAVEAGASDVHFMPMGTTPETASLELDASEWPECRAILEDIDQRLREAGIGTNARGLLTVQRPDVCRDIYGRIPCYMGSTFSLVFADGQVRFCCGCDRTMGNLNESGLSVIWRGDAYARMRREAIRLPRTGVQPDLCACFRACPQWMENVSTHRRLYPRWQLEHVLPAQQ